MDTDTDTNMNIDVDVGVDSMGNMGSMDKASVPSSNDYDDSFFTYSDLDNSDGNDDDVDMDDDIDMDNDMDMDMDMDIDDFD
jgi:hypothetical protein